LATKKSEVFFYLPASERIYLKIHLSYILILTHLLFTTNISYGLRPAASTKLTIQRLEAELTRKSLARSESVQREESWVSQNAPELEDFTGVSFQMEAGLDRKILEKIIEAYGAGQARAAGQATMTGGLGALIHDLACAWKKNGGDILAIHPLWNNIKGIVEGLPELPQGMNNVGDLIRFALREHSRSDLSFSFKYEQDDIVEFCKNTRCDRAKTALRNEIHVDVYELKTKFGEAPLVYLDAYYLGTKGERVYIFDQVYPDNVKGYPDEKDFRAVHMAVYNTASQLLIKMMQEKGEVKENIFAIENEVFVSFPKEAFIKFHINHTVWKPGMYKPPWYAFRLLGFDKEIRDTIVRHGEIDMAEYVGLRADIISGVSIYEHTSVLRRNVFRAYQHRVRTYMENGIRNTNGALFDQWQGMAFRSLIDSYKDKFKLDRFATDEELFDILDREGNAESKREFQEQLDVIKSLYMLDLLILFKDTQKQELGGSEWLAQTLEDTKYDVDDIETIRDKFYELILRALAGEKDLWIRINEEFGELTRALMKNPIASNLRRQVSYKGPDKYWEMFKHIGEDEKALLGLRTHTIETIDSLLEHATQIQRDDKLVKAKELQIFIDHLIKLEQQIQRFATDQVALERFKRSGTRLIIGGRIFDKESESLYRTLKDMVEELGLEDQIAFMENYSIKDAPLIFRGVNATIMLTDEFVEASATSMMKALPNCASLIGVWGGAMPELFTIRDREIGRIIDVIKEGITYDDLMENIRSRRYEILNGYLVEYLPIAEQSSSHGDGRRPSADNLLNALVWLGHTHNLDHKNLRLTDMYEALKSSVRVDMERGQARAHLMMVREAMLAKREFNDFISTLREGGADKTIQYLLAKEAFDWQYKKGSLSAKPETLHNHSEVNFIGFLDSFRWVRADENGLNSLLFHSGNNAHGDVLKHLQEAYLTGEPSIAPLVEKIGEFIERIEAVNAGDAGNSDKILLKAFITFEAMDFVDRVATALLNDTPNAESSGLPVRPVVNFQPRSKKAVAASA